MWYENMQSWPNLTLGVFVLSLVLIGVVVAAVTRRPSPPPSPEDVLRMRFARGEIDQAELEAGLAALRTTRH